MMRRFIRVLIKFVLLAFFVLKVSDVSALDVPPERTAYQGNPLTVSLTVGKERRVTFPHPVYTDIPESLSTKLTTQIVGGDLYWTASEPFGPIRVVVGEEGGNRVYLLNLQGVAQDIALPQLIVSTQKEETEASKDEDATKPDDQNQSRLGYGGLFRYAALQLYAPARLREQESDQALTPGPIPMGRIHHLIRYHRVETYAMAAWHSDMLTVTALIVKNETNMPVTLDPREIRGDILAARFHRNHLRPGNTEGDTTTLFVITRRPLAESITGHAVRIDPPLSGKPVSARTAIN